MVVGLVALLAGVPMPSAAASGLRRAAAKSERPHRGVADKGETAAARRSGARRLRPTALSRSRRPRGGEQMAEAAAPRAVADRTAPENATTATRKSSGLVARARAGWAKVPRPAKLLLAGLAVGGALAGSWALPAVLGVKLAVMGGVVALSGLGGLYARARGKNAGWKQSPSFAAMATIEEAAGRSDAKRLDELEGAQRERHASLSGTIAAARRRGAKRLSDGTSVKDAARELDFIGLALARSSLHEAATSVDAGSRMGQRTVDSWTESVGGLDADAQATDFEGNLALELDALDTELEGEGRAADGVSEAIEAYGKHVPRLFGGDMKAARDSTRGLLETFVTSEINRERALHERATGAMRGRVTKRLVARDRTFARRHDRMERLTALEEATGEVNALAEDIDSELASAISHRESEQHYLMIAASKTAVPVTKTRTGANGQSETYTDIEDQSGTWKAMAWSEGDAANAAGRRAKSGLERLRPMVEQLRANETLVTEELNMLLPEVNGSGVDPGDDGLMAFIGPPIFRLLMGDGSNVRRVRDSFRPDLAAIQRVHGETGARRQTERTWVDGKVTDDIDRQKAEARKR